jgi:hypothetical protein
MHLDLSDLPRDAVHDLVYWGRCYVSGWCCILPQLIYLDSRDRYADGVLWFLVSREWPYVQWRPDHTHKGHCTCLVFSVLGNPSQVEGKWRPTELMWMNSILLTQLMTVPWNGKTAIKTESSIRRNFLRWTESLKSLIIMVAFCLKISLRNSNSLWWLSQSQRALALWPKVQSMACLLGGWEWRVALIERSVYRCLIALSGPWTCSHPHSYFPFTTYESSFPTWLTFLLWR